MKCPYCSSIDTDSRTSLVPWMSFFCNACKQYFGVKK